MAQVRMLLHISGGRGAFSDETGVWEGGEWPQAGETLECGDAEAAQLVGMGVAERVAPPAPPARTERPAGDAPAVKPRASGARTAPQTPKG